MKIRGLGGRIHRTADGSLVLVEGGAALGTPLRIGGDLLSAIAAYEILGAGVDGAVHMTDLGLHGTLIEPGTALGAGLRIGGDFGTAIGADEVILLDCPQLVGDIDVCSALPACDLTGKHFEQVHLPYLQQSECH